MYIVYAYLQWCDTGGICLRLILFSQYIKKSLPKKVQKEVHAKKNYRV